MLTYGSLCLISFLQHFAADPSYRPTFKSKWYLSLMGALACLGLMFFMNPIYALLSLVMMVVFYVVISYYNKDKQNLAVIFQGGDLRWSVFRRILSSEFQLLNCSVGSRSDTVLGHTCT